MTTKSWSRVALPLAVSFFVLGCASDRYHYGVGKVALHGPTAASGSQSSSGQLRITRGGDHATLDRVEEVVHAPGRWIGKMFGREQLSGDEASVLRNEGLLLSSDYFLANGLTGINVDVHAYSPKLQWSRLVANKEISPIWKYTGGTVSWLRYTLLPHRVLHQNDFDPFTNTLSLNSTRPLQGLYESAVAKEYFYHRDDIGMGNYAMLQYVPFAPLWHHGRATQDVLTYSDHHLDPELDRQLYPLVWARLGSTAVSETLSVFTVVPSDSFLAPTMLRISGSLAGRLAGKEIANKKYRDVAAASYSSDSDTASNSSVNLD
ncbi:MAG: hypothetical protein AAF394_02555 [Planctomycetota bacterium]